MLKMLIDSIEERKDLHQMVHDWHYIVTPLIEAIRINPDESKLPDFYVETTRADYTLSYWLYNKRPLLDLSSSELSININKNLLIGTIDVSVKPTTVIGEPGTGKSTWIRNYFHNSLKKIFTEKQFNYCIYDHHVSAGNLLGSPDPTINMRQTILYEVLKMLQASNKICGVHTSLNSINLGEVKASELIDNMGLYDRMRDNVSALKGKGHLVWLVIDNLDRYSYAEQKSGTEIAGFLSGVCGIYTVVPLRPYVYPGFIQHLGDRTVALPPPDLHEVLAKRVKYIKNNPNEIDSFLKTCEEIISKKIDPHWCSGRLKSKEDIVRLYKDIIHTIGYNDTLIKLLSDLRNSNIRKSLNDVANLLTYGYFSEAMTSCIKDNSKKIDGNTVITTYLRGPFLRYRGGNRNNHNIEVVNLFDLPGMNPLSAEKLLGFRLLQILHGKTSPNNTEGLKYITLENILSQFKYAPSKIKEATTYFLRKKLFKEINKCKNWLDTRSVLEDDDEIIISSAGLFYIDQFLGLYSLRYCEAMSNVTQFHARFFLEHKIRPGLSIDSVCNNTYYLLEEHRKVLMNEIKTLSKIKIDSETTLYDLLARETARGGSLFFNAVKNCHDLFIMHYDKNANKEGDKEWDSLKKKWDCLYGKAHQILSIHSRSLGADSHSTDLTV